MCFVVEFFVEIVVVEHFDTLEYSVADVDAFEVGEVGLGLGYFETNVQIAIHYDCFVNLGF